MKEHIKPLESFKKTTTTTTTTQECDTDPIVEVCTF